MPSSSISEPAEITSLRHLVRKVVIPQVNNHMVAFVLTLRERPDFVEGQFNLWWSERCQTIFDLTMSGF